MYKKLIILGLLLILIVQILAPSIVGKGINAVSVVTKKIVNKKMYSDSPSLLVSSEFEPDNYWALIISVDYKDKSLPYYPKYAKVKDNLISNYWYEDHIKTVIGKKATKKNVKAAFYDWLVKNAGEGSTAFIYFMAHGYKRNPLPPYWPPGGLSLWGYKDGNGCLDENALQYDVLGDWLDDLRASNIVVIISSCYSGDAIRYLKGEGRVVITSAKWDEMSYSEVSGSLPDAIFKADNFYGNQGKGKRDGFVSAEEIYTYCEYHTRKSHPQIWDSNPENEIVLACLKPLVNIITPETNRLYVFDREIMTIPASESIIIGSITITVSADDPEGIRNVEFYIDNELKYNATKEPYSWRWSELSVGYHTIKIVVYDNTQIDYYAYSSEDMIRIFKYF